jgi:hypothetical protein
LNEASLADGGGAGESENTGIAVDLDAEDGKAVVRQKPRSATPKPTEGRYNPDALSKEMKKRLERQARGFNQQIADQQAAHQRELAEIRGRLDKLSVNREDVPAGDDAAHSEAMEKLQADLEEAQERGDSKAVAKITRDMSSLEGKYWAAKASKAGVQENRNGQQQAAAQPAAQTKPTKAGAKWAKANADWWNDTTDPTACGARALANSLYATFKADGDDIESDELYEKIRKEVQKRFPEVQTFSTLRSRQSQLDDDDDPETAGDDDPAPQNRRGPPSLPNRGDVPRRQNLQTLTQADIATMRQVNLDPNNNKHVLQFIRSKQEVAENEA